MINSMKGLKSKILLGGLVFLLFFIALGITAYADTKYSTTTSSSIYLDVESESYQIAPGKEFSTDIVIHNANDIYAEDISIEYDRNLFEYIGASTQTTTSSSITMNNEYEITTSSAISIYYENTHNPGRAQFIVVSKGKENGINNSKKILKLTFRANNTNGQGIIKVIRGRAADGQGNEFNTLCGCKTYKLVNCDVNSNGKISLGDLAIAGRLYNTNRYYWNYYKPDINGNGFVDELDLKEIVKQILNKQ